MWAYQADAKGKVTSQQVFCISVGSPDQRSGAPCLDAHRVICMFVPGAVKLWMDNIVAAPPAQFAAIAPRARKEENLDFCYLTVRFQQKSQSCGCFIYDANYVATTARCVYE